MTGYKPNRIQRIRKAHPDLSLEQIRFMLCGAYISYYTNPESDPDKIHSHLNHFVAAIEQMSTDDIQELFPTKYYDRHN